MSQLTRLSAIAFLTLGAAGPVLAADPVLPDPQLTPGVVVTSDPAIICHAGYSRSVRHTSGRMKHEIYVEYGVDHSGGHYEVDHLVPLSLGGADVARNLWVQSYDGNPWNAHRKDRLEWRLLHLACYGPDGPLPAAGIAALQHDIAANWILTYQKYCPTEADCPSYSASHAGEE